MCALEFLNINDTKLKITLTAEECSLYHIDTANSNFSGNDIKRSLRDILAIAERESGFCTGTERILVQICPLPDMSCELFITRLVNLSRRDRDDLTATPGISLIEKKVSVYRFDSAEELINAVKIAYREGIDSDLYRDDLGRYYIRAGEEVTDGISELEIFVEFGERISSVPIAVLSEYGTLLAKKNAIDKIYLGDIAELK